MDVKEIEDFVEDMEDDIEDDIEEIEDFEDPCHFTCGETRNQ